MRKYTIYTDTQLVVFERADEGFLEYEILVVVWIAFLAIGKGCGVVRYYTK